MYFAINNTTMTAATDTSFNSARGRNRINAIYRIRQRILHNDTGDIFFDEITNDNKLQIQQAIHRIITGDRSCFSVQYMADNIQMLSRPFPISFLYEPTSNTDAHISCCQQNMQSTDIALIGFEQINSWYYPNGLEKFEQTVQLFSTCTLLEFATWTKRYGIVGQLLLGGVSPCIRGQLCNGHHNADSRHDDGRSVLSFFLGKLVPIPLQTYIVSRVIAMRIKASHCQNTVNEDAVCNAKQSSISQSMLAFTLDNDSSCDHMFCEDCFWQDITDNLEFREGNVVKCPVCTKNDTLHDTCINHASFLSSRQLYYALPLTCKAQKGKNKKNNKPDICSTWSEAVKPSLGQSQSVRRDKFFTHVDKGLYNHVKEMLVLGIDPDLQNEYGQTALHIAVWKQYVRIADLLVMHTDRDICDNSGLTAHDMAVRLNNNDLIDLFPNIVGEKASSTAFPLMHDTEHGSSLAESRTIIELDEDHPGAGSYMIDDCLSSDTIDRLTMLWKKLPVQEAIKKVPCSIRSYFCDSLGIVGDNMKQAIVKTLHQHYDDVDVYPHMRFLFYKESGIFLAPHVDLTRLHPMSGRRSTHTFILYLNSCQHGGETTLLRSLTSSCSDLNNITERVKPVSGRLLLFPHQCPHMGEETMGPKLILRGEVYLRQRL